MKDQKLINARHIIDATFYVMETLNGIKKNAIEIFDGDKDKISSLDIAIKKYAINMMENVIDSIDYTSNFIRKTPIDIKEKLSETL